MTYANSSGEGEDAADRAAPPISITKRKVEQHGNAGPGSKLGLWERHGGVVGHGGRLDRALREKQRRRQAALESWSGPRV